MSEEKEQEKGKKKKVELLPALEAAVALVLEQEPPRWGADAHLAMLVYAVVGLDPAHAKKGLGELKKLPPETQVVVPFGELKKTLLSSAKLAECSNFGKLLVERGDLAVADSGKYI